jgi:hypothetical protein
MLTRVLLYGYAIGESSSRRIEQATYDDVAFRYLAADQHPDHDTIASFRQQHLESLGRLFVQALRLCQKAGLVKLGHVAVFRHRRPPASKNRLPTSAIRSSRTPADRGSIVPSLVACHCNLQHPRIPSCSTREPV